MLCEQRAAILAQERKSLASRVNPTPPTHPAFIPSLRETSTSFSRDFFLSCCHPFSKKQLSSFPSFCFFPDENRPLIAGASKAPHFPYRAF
uniref:Uncharacterized protein n=1 Tax=Parascaris univalens TaxID=6257 RepID=A0A915BZH7_PARUN